MRLGCKRVKVGQRVEREEEKSKVFAKWKIYCSIVFKSV